MLKFMIGFLGILLCSQAYANNCFVRSRHRHHDVVDLVIESKQIVYGADYFLGLNGSYGVGESLRAEARETDSLELQKDILELRKDIFALRQQLRGFSGETKPKPVDPIEPVDPTDLPKGTDLDDKVLKIFKAYNCAKCHSPDNDEGRLSLVKLDGTMADLSVAQKGEIYDRTYAVGMKERGKKAMPLGGKPVSNEDVELIRLWFLKAVKETEK